MIERSGHLLLPLLLLVGISAVASQAAQAPADPLALAPRAQPAPLSSGDWPFYGADLANSRSSDGGPTRSEARRLGPAWSFKSTDGDFAGTPVVVGGTLVSLASGGTVFALDAGSGKPKWSRDLNHYLNGTAAIYRGVVYVPVDRPTADRPTLAALKLSDGTLLWETVLDRQPGSDLYGSPVPWKGRIYIGVSAGVGEEEGEHTRGSVIAVDARTGRIDWKTFAVPRGRDGGGVWSTPAIDKRTRRLYVGTSNAIHRPAARTTDAVLALDARTGRLVRSHQVLAGDVSRGEPAPPPDADLGASPNLLWAGLVGEYQKSRIYWALDRRTLDVAWRRTTSVPRRRLPDALASTAFDGRYVYGQSEIGETWALDRRGTRVWMTRRDGTSNYSPLAVSNGVLYVVTSRGVLRARDTRTGRSLATLPLGGRSYGGISVAGGSVYVATGTAHPQPRTSDAGYIVRYRPR